VAASSAAGGVMGGGSWMVVHLVRRNLSLLRHLLRCFCFNGCLGVNEAVKLDEACQRADS